MDGKIGWIFLERFFFSSRTALHWAAKRNHSQVVGFLLNKGADRDIQAHDQSIPAHVCTDDSLRAMLQSTISDSKKKQEEQQLSFQFHLDDNSSPCTNQSSLPIIPNYLRNPVFPYVASSPSTSLPSTNDQQQTITLLCRIANDPTEIDFVEFDFPKQPNSGSYDRLRSLICEELNLVQIDRLRRLPCVRVRHDRDVERLKDNDMLEVILSTSTQEKNPS